MRIVKQNWFKNLGELHKEWTEDGDKASRATTHRRVKEVVIRGVLPGLRRRRTGLLPSGPKSSFQMRASFVFHLETKVLESGWRVEKLIDQVAWSPVLSFHSLWSFGVQCHLLVLVHCGFWKPTSLHSFTKTFGALHASFCWPAFQRCWFHFPAGFGTCPHCQKHQKLVKWPWCWCSWLAIKLTRPEPHRESAGYCQEENEKQETKNADELKATVKETWASIPPQQCHKLITSMPRQIEAVIKAKRVPTKYWVHIQYTNILSSRPTIH